MAIKIQFALNLGKVKVNNMSELKKYFQLDYIIINLSDGRLIKWLRDRNENEIADKIVELSLQDKELPQKLCDIFGMQNTFNTTVEKALEKGKKLKTLKDYTSEQKFIDNIDNMAFSQEELEQLINNGVAEIYLYGDKFKIPSNTKNISYISVNNPVIIQENSNKTNKDNQTKYLLPSKSSDNKIENKENISSNINCFSKGYCKTFCDIMLSPAQKQSSKQCFDMISSILNDINYSPDDDIKEIKKFLISQNIVGLGQTFIDNL